MRNEADSGAVFRAGLPRDRAAIHSLLLRSNLSAPAKGGLERVNRSRIGEILSFVVEKNGQVAGVLQWRNLGEEVEILDLAVDPAYRRQGHAAFLLRNFLKEASRSAVKKVFLEVRDSNAAALALYQKFGFQISGRRPNYYRNPRENALLLALAIPG
jgi:[ribosomal protein S18]-alanine N-acetyltransferase